MIAVPEDLAVVGGFQTAGEPQECCFSAAALTEDHGDLSSRDFKIDAVQDRKCPAIDLICLMNVF